LIIGTGTFSFHPYEGQTIRWFADSPDAGEPNCLCSLCGKLIEEDDSPIRCVVVYPEDREARFHFACYPLVDPRHFEGREPLSS
jgi:hypothetical protein